MNPLHPDHMTAEERLSELGEILARGIGRLTQITEIEINRVVLDCTRARRQMLGSVSNSRPTRH